MSEDFYAKQAVVIATGEADPVSGPPSGGNLRLFVAREHGASPVLTGELWGRQPSQCAMGSRIG